MLISHSRSTDSNGASTLLNADGVDGVDGQLATAVPRARVVDLAVTFERRGAPLRALRGVSLDIAAGEILAVVGESGSGTPTRSRRRRASSDDPAASITC